MEPRTFRGYAEAVEWAHRLHSKVEAAGEAAYEKASYDGAMAQITLGSALRLSGNAKDALVHLESARRRFERLAQRRMAVAAVTAGADCLRDLGRYDEAATAYEQAIRIYEELNDLRSMAVGKGQLATVSMLRKDYASALALHAEARTLFERLNEPVMVAVAWHQIGTVYAHAEIYETAEQAYQTSLKLKIQTGNRAGQALTLTQLGNLNAMMGRPEEAVRLLRQAADIAVELRDIRSEGLCRSNIALYLIQLHLYNEARPELQRAIECNRPFGDVAEPWKTFNILSALERSTGNEPAARAARDEALAAYLAYRRQGGAPRFDVPDPLPDANPSDPDLYYGVAAEIILRRERSARAT